MQEKTFREVIVDIKEGEVWEGTDLLIIKHSNILEITWKDGKEDDGVAIYTHEKFWLQRKQYSFEEAFKAYEEGKEIESVNGVYKYKKIDGIDSYKLSVGYGEWEKCGEETCLEVREIRGKWYINN